MKENVSGCFFSEHSVDSLLWGSTVGYPSDSLASLSDVRCNSD